MFFSFQHHAIVIFQRINYISKELEISIFVQTRKRATKFEDRI